MVSRLTRSQVHDREHPRRSGSAQAIAVSSSNALTRNPYVLLGCPSGRSSSSVVRMSCGNMGSGVQESPDCEGRTRRAVSRSRR